MRNKIIMVIICFITLIIGINLGSKTTTLNESKKYLSNEELTNIELTQKLEELKTKVSNLEVVNGNTVIGGTITSSINNLNNSLANGKIRFGIDSEGNYGYIKDGEDVVNAFKSDAGLVTHISGTSTGGTTPSVTYTFLEDYSKVTITTMTMTAYSATVLNMINDRSGYVPLIYYNNELLTEYTNNQVNQIYNGEITCFEIYEIENVKAGDTMKFTTNSWTSIFADIFG